MSTELNTVDFNFLREYAEILTGSTFSDDKKYLFETRLIGMANEFGFTSTMALVNHLRDKRQKISLEQKNYFIDIMTTHETLFFRDTSPFQILKEYVLPELLNQGKKDFYIYSAACSRGQEPISISLTLSEYLELNSMSPFKYQIIATDISKAAIDYAKQACYTKLEVDRGLTQKQLTQYFETQSQSNAWMLKEPYLSPITYQIENLLDPISRLAKFDIIFCRNVTIYMDEKKVRKIYEFFYSKLKDGGFFFVGHSERMAGHRDLFDYINTGVGSVYRKR